MIERKDLREGNLVSLAHESNIPIVTINELRENWATFKEKDYFTSRTYNLIMPIPLSPDWLVNFGFEKKIILGNSSGYWYVKDGLSYNESHKGWWYRGSISDDVEPKYVHELQNLYYFLNKNELQLTNNKTVN